VSQPGEPNIAKANKLMPEVVLSREDLDVVLHMVLYHERTIMDIKKKKVLIISYWGVQYHLEKWGQAQQWCIFFLFNIIIIYNICRPIKAEELYNL
jgi:hypothetical protein